MFKSKRDRGLKLAERREYAKALPLLRDVVREAETPGVEHLALGECEAHVSGDLREIERRCRECAGHVEEVVILQWEGSVKFDVGRTEEGIALMRRAIELGPGRGPFYTLAARLDKIGQDKEAIDLYERILARYPKDIYALIDCATCYTELENLEEAERLLLRALDVNPADGSAHYGLGGVFARQDRVEDALSQFRLAVKHKYYYLAHAYAAMADCFIILGEIRKARRAARKAVKIAPNDEYALGTLAEAEGPYDD